MDLRICVFGAGSIGCYVGGRLAAAGANLRFVARPRIAAVVRRHGLQLSDHAGAQLRVAPAALAFDEDPAAAAGADLVLVCVKSDDTATAAAQLAEALHPGALVLSLQNGLGNAVQLRGALPRQTVLAGMVPFNVVNRGDGAFHQGSSGDLMAETHAALRPFLPAFERAGLPLRLRGDMREVLWGKLLLNLNNPVNALSDLPLKQELSQRAYRRCVALAQREGLQALQAAGIRVARLTPLPAPWLPRVLELPDALFRSLAGRMLAIDPLARSSMWEDLQAGRRTEVDWINGEIVRLAAVQGRPAPVNARLVELVRVAEQQNGRRRWSGEALLAELQAAPAGRGGS